MEDEKKKKKNKKKKGKQTKTSEDVAVSVGEATSLEHNHVIKQNYHIQVSGIADRSTDGALEADGNQGRHHPNSVKGINLDEVEKQDWLQREAILEEKVRQLQSEKDSCMQREVDLEEKILYLQNEKDSWLQKEASMEEKNKQLLNEKAFWNLQVVSLEEKITLLESDKDSWVLKEHASIDLKTQMEASHALVEKLIREKAELVEKVNELELNQQSLTAGTSSEVGFNTVVGLAETATVADYRSEFSERLSESGESVEPLASVQGKDESTNVDSLETESNRIAVIQVVEEPQVVSSYGAGETEDEIVQVPLDENEVSEPESQALALDSDDKGALPLSDAPLIGAPFRLISFVAKYVSGADLVNKKGQA